MSLKRIFSSIILISIALLITATCVTCSKPESDAELLLGKWKLVRGEVSDRREEITFYSNGTCYTGGEHGEWSIVDGTIKILGTCGGGQFWYGETIIGTYSVTEDTLTIEPHYGDTLIYEKVQ